MSFSDGEENVAQSFALAHAGYKQIMGLMKRLASDENQEQLAKLTAYAPVATEAVQHCTELLRAMYKQEATKLEPKAEHLLGQSAALIKAYYDSQWKVQVVTLTSPSPILAEEGESSLGLNQDLIIARINLLVDELVELVKNDQRACKLVRTCLGIQTQLLQMHAMFDGLKLAAELADYAPLFDRNFQLPLLRFGPQMVAFMFSVHNRVDAKMPNQG